MSSLSRGDRWLRACALASILACGVGSAVGIYYVLVPIPALAASRLDLLMGTLLRVAVSLLFAVAALLICLAYLVIRARAARAGAAGG